MALILLAVYLEHVQMSEELKAALARIACLEGEIAKRDETIARLEPQLNRAIQANYDLREELAACRVAVENCDLFLARIAELEARIVWLECEAQLYAAPVSEAKAQGVVLDGSQLAGLLEQVRLDDDEAKPHGSGATYWNNAVVACQVAIRDALAAPVQQESVPDVLREAIKWADHLCFECGALVQTRAPSVHVYNKTFEAVQAAKAMLAAAPAAPAADAPPESCRQRLAAEGKPYPRSSCAACGQFSPKWRECDAAIAAHRAKGVV